MKSFEKSNLPCQIVYKSPDPRKKRRPQWPGLTFKNSLIVAKLENETCHGSRSKPTVGIETPWKRGSFTVENVQFVNFDEENCVAIDPCYKAYKNDCGNTGKFSRTKFVNSPNRKCE